MEKMARLVHLLGLALFLGSILAFAVASAVPVSGDLASLVVARRVISRGTTFLTLPGLVLLVMSGVTLLARRWSVVGESWLRVMVIAAALVVANAALIVVPAVRSATALAETSALMGRLAPEYQRAYMTESLAGGVNIVFVVVAMAAGVWRYRATSGQLR